ncbi:RES domain-containing protein [Nakamurella sp. YIM 132087]|uniref:RES domain-containing protein n=1 Tax=Nakamurella alba TaxID=2665158 RepID=A0A7K1FLS8_9ACTN|nr:RES family NAD+ phosphorylase [Nakamurella alba]MTD15066.1 RES domain-containing protein [Nakamurella alba]
MAAFPKVPASPPGLLTAQPDDIRSFTGALWRINVVKGRHPSVWNGFRTFGPTGSRWDPHPSPPGDHAGFGVLYTATEPATCAAEVFQLQRTIVLSDHHALTGWQPTRPLRLLDLTGGWALRQGASNSLSAADRVVCRRWAAAIRLAWPALDGLYVLSTMTGVETVVLFEPAGDSFPAAPNFQRPLDHPLVHALMDRASARCGYRLA